MTGRAESDPMTFEEFRRSFYYGEHADMQFKFLAQMPDRDAADAVADVLSAVGEVLDTGDLTTLHDVVYRVHVEGHRPDEAVPPANDVPFAPVAPRWADLLSSRGINAAVLVASCPVCHSSVAQLSHALENAGIATVAIGVRALEHRFASLGVPRALLTPHLIGRTVGPVGDQRRQRAVVAAALDLLAEAEKPGEMRYFD